MQFLRFSIVVLSILACAASISAQEAGCALTQAPELHGFQLGMHLSEVQGNLSDPTMLNSRVLSDSKTGVSAIRIKGSDLKPENGEGVDDLNLSFVDGKLTVLRVTYDGAGKWESARDFFEQVSKNLGLPKPSSAGRLTEGESGKYQITCNQFTVMLAYSYGVSPTITISNTAAQSVVEQRKSKEPKSQKKGIGPVLGPRPPQPGLPD